MGQLVDTSVFIALERQQLDLETLVAMLPEEPISLAAITASELLVGVHYADSAARREQRLAFVEQIIAGVPVVPFDLSVARVYARTLADLRMAGQTLGAHDLQIAATALRYDFELATYDVRDFGRVPRLIVRQIESLAERGPRPE